MHQMDIQKRYLARKWKKNKTKKNQRTHNRKSKKTQYSRMHSMDRQYIALLRRLKN